jgi:hypothetical protein
MREGMTGRCGTGATTRRREYNERQRGWGDKRWRGEKETDDGEAGATDDGEEGATDDGDDGATDDGDDGAMDDGEDWTLW